MILAACPACGEQAKFPAADDLEAVAICLRCNNPCVMQDGRLRALNNEEWKMLFGMTDPIARTLCLLKAQHN